MTTHQMKLGKLQKRNSFAKKSARNVVEILSELKYPKYIIPSTSSSSRVREMFHWCDNNLTSQNWLCYGDAMWFTNDQYFTMFLLRWAE